MRHVITLSTIPPRFDMLGPALRSLVAQTSRPEAVEVWIPQSYRRFPQWGGGLPEVPAGVTIRRTDEDFGPGTKVLPAVRARRGENIELIYVDDDRVFARDWAKLCLSSRQSRPNAVICGAGFNISRYGYPDQPEPAPRAVFASDPRAQIGIQIKRLLRTLSIRRPAVELDAPWHRISRSGHVDIAEGYGGVMLRPEFLDDQVFDIPPVLWTVDDIWLSGMLTRLGVPIWAEPDLFDVREILPISRHFPLYKATIEGAGRDAANRACIDYMRETYGIWGGVAPARE